MYGYTVVMHFNINIIINKPFCLCLVLQIGISIVGLTLNQFFVFSIGPAKISQPKRTFLEKDIWYRCKNWSNGIDEKRLEWG
jgi:hypothetical protein